MNRIAIVTSSRAEYGLLRRLIQCILKDEVLELDLIVTGAHLSKKQGNTLQEIVADGFPIAHKLPILEEDNSPYGIGISMANALREFALCFHDDRPDMVIILGDRTEMIGVACAAMNERIPIAHIHGGEVTTGAVDDCVRHALTKMSYLHFTSTEWYRRRVIQLGESPERVFNVGALGAENIIHMDLMDEQTVRHEIGLPDYGKYAVVTYHPVTLENESIGHQIDEICSVMENRTDLFFLITAANADAGGDEVNRCFIEFSKLHNNSLFVTSLGTRRYLSAIKFAALVLGNSSSGIIEAPVLGTPTINIGDRQKGRILAESVFCCKPQMEAIEEAINSVMSVGRVKTMIYGEGDTSIKIIVIIKEYLINHKIDLKKTFFDVNYENE